MLFCGLELIDSECVSCRAFTVLVGIGARMLDVGDAVFHVVGLDVGGEFCPLDAAAHFLLRGLKCVEKLYLIFHAVVPDDSRIAFSNKWYPG